MSTTDLLADELYTLNWSAARLILVSNFIIAAVRLRSVNLSLLANAFETDVEVESNSKRLQRFFRFFQREQPTFVITNNRHLELKDVLIAYASLWHIENKITELVSFLVRYALLSKFYALLSKFND